MKKQVLKLSRETWDALTTQQKQEQREKYDVTVAQHYYAAADLDTPIELTPVARMGGA